MLVSLCRGLPLAVLLLVTHPLAAEKLPLADAERIALAHDAELQRLQKLREAAHHNAVADGALPDPELRLGYLNLPTDSFSTREEPMTQLRIGAQQRFPAGSSRRLQRERGETEAEALAARAAERTLAVRLAVREAWLDWRHAGLALAEAVRAREDFDALVELIAARVASGTARQRDLHQARLELAALAERAIGLRGDREVAAAELSRWLDAPLSAERSAGSAPDWPSPEAQAVLKERLQQHPSLRQARLQRGVSAKETELAREAYKPQWALSVDYGLRREARAVGREDLPDLLSGMVSLSVPLFSGNRQDQRLAAASANQSAADAALQEHLRALSGRLERQLALWQRLDELASFYDETLLQEADALIDSSESAYRSERASVDELIRARVDTIHHRLRSLRIQRDRAVARAELLYLEGE